MSNKYLEKIASKAKEEGPGFGTAVAVSLPVATLSQAVGSSASHAALKKSKMYHGVGYENEARASTIRKFIRDNKLDVTFKVKNHKRFRNGDKSFFSGIVEGAMDSMSAGKHGPLYMHSKGFGYTKNFINSGKGYFKHDKMNDMIMHELGHAKNWKNMPKSVVAGHAIWKGGAGEAVSGIGSAALLSNEKTSKYAPIVPAVHELPTLLDEGLAHGHAFNAIRKANGLKSGLRYIARSGAPAYGTYVGSAAGKIGGVYLAHRILKHIRDKKNK